MIRTRVPDRFPKSRLGNEPDKVRLRPAAIHLVRWISPYGTSSEPMPRYQQLPPQRHRQVSKRGNDVIADGRTLEEKSGRQAHERTHHTDRTKLHSKPPATGSGFIVSILARIEKGNLCTIRAATKSCKSRTIKAWAEVRSSVPAANCRSNCLRGAAGCRSPSLRPWWRPSAGQKPIWKSRYWHFYLV